MRLFLLPMLLLAGCCRKSDWKETKVSELIPRYQSSNLYYFDLYSETCFQDTRIEPSKQLIEKILNILKKAAAGNEQKKEDLKHEFSPGPMLFPPVGTIVMRHDELPELRISIIHDGSIVYLHCGNKSAMADVSDDSETFLELIKLARSEQSIIAIIGETMMEFCENMELEETMKQNGEKPR